MFVNVWTNDKMLEVEDGTETKLISPSPRPPRLSEQHSFVHKNACPVITKSVKNAEEEKTGN